jgi:hypothetical protein
VAHSLEGKVRVSQSLLSGTLFSADKRKNERKTEYDAETKTETNIQTHRATWSGR